MWWSQASHSHRKRREKSETHASIFIDSILSKVRLPKIGRHRKRCFVKMKSAKRIPSLRTFPIEAYLQILLDCKPVSLDQCEVCKSCRQWLLLVPSGLRDAYPKRLSQPPPSAVLFTNGRWVSEACASKAPLQAQYSTHYLYLIPWPVGTRQLFPSAVSFIWPDSIKSLLRSRLMTPMYATFWGVEPNTVQWLASVHGEC